MSKYINAEILYREVDRLMAHYATAEKEMEDDVELSIFYQGKRKMCSEIINHITALQQEQPEVDLEKEYKTWWNSIADKINIEHMMEWYMHETARHFYELGLKARKEE